MCPLSYGSLEVHSATGFSTFHGGELTTDIVVDNCAICRNHIMDLCE